MNTEQQRKIGSEIQLKDLIYRFYTWGKAGMTVERKRIRKVILPQQLQGKKSSKATKLLRTIVSQWPSDCR